MNKFALGKRSLALDITTPDGVATFAKIIENIDVLIENYSPRVLPNLGFTQERLQQLNPSLIYVTMPGYGRTGPAKDYSAYGPVLDSHAGLSTLMGYPDVDAWKCGIAWPDPVAGIHAAFAVLAALWERSGVGEGTTIEVAQFETTITMIADRLVRAQLDDADPDILGNRHETDAPQGVYRSQGDDQWVAVSVSDDAAWVAFCAHIDAPIQWSFWSRPERMEHHDAIDAVVAQWAMHRSAVAAASGLQAVGVAAAPVADAAMLQHDPHLQARGFFTEIAHPEAGTHPWAPSCAARLSHTPASVTRPAPCLGQHNREVLRAWGLLTDTEIAALLERGTIATEPAL